MLPLQNTIHGGSFKFRGSILFSPVLFTLLTFIKPVLGVSQSDLGTWNILNMKYSFSKKVSIFAEGQIRSLSTYSQFHYHEYKCGFNYKPSPQIMFTLGLGDYDTYREGGNFESPKNNDERRLWPQITLYQTIGKVKIEQRYRSESRFSPGIYRNRFRYRVGISIPFGKEKDGAKSFQFIVNNELFFTNTAPYFQRNRFLIATQYRINKVLSTQVGYLTQFDYKINDETGRQFLQIGLYLDLHRPPKKE